jgi:hypothetical protein
MEGVGVAAGDGLGGGESGGEEQEGEDPDSRGCDALREFGQSMSPDVSQCLRLCWQKKAADERRPFCVQLPF